MRIFQVEGKAICPRVDSYICYDRSQTYEEVADRIRVGTKVSFNAFDGLGLSNAFLAAQEDDVIGKIVCVHWDHKWFEVEYGNAPAFRTGFNFTDIGHTIRIL